MRPVPSCGNSSVAGRKPTAWAYPQRLKGAVDEMFLIGPELAKNAKVAWPDVNLIDQHAPYAQQERSKF